MKRITVMLAIVLMLFYSLPINVKAATTYVKEGNTYKSSSDISMGKYGTVKAGDATYTYTDEGEGIKTWTFYLTAGQDLDYVWLDLLPVALEIQSVRAGDRFNKLSSSNDKLLLEVKNSGSVKKGDRVLLFTVITKDTATTGCTLSWTPQYIDPCTTADGNYFDKSGKRVSEEEYKASCEAQPSTPNDPVMPPDDPNDIPNSDTGSVIPYVAIAGGLIAIAGVYMYSKKANKMYKL